MQSEEMTALQITKKFEQINKADQDQKAEKLI